MVLFLYDWPVEHLSERIGIGDGRRTIQTLTRVGCSRKSEFRVCSKSIEVILREVEDSKLVFAVLLPEGLGRSTHFEHTANRIPQTSREF